MTASQGKANNRYVILGSGTGVGKTHVAVSLLLAWRSIGIAAVGLKPVESGVEPSPPRRVEFPCTGHPDLLPPVPASAPARASAPAPSRSASPLLSIPDHSSSQDIGQAGPAPAELEDSVRLELASAPDYVLPSGRGHSSPTNRPMPDPIGVPPYRFQPPVSPHLAARQAGVRIELGRIREWVLSNPAPTIVETAGGLFSPLGPGMTNFELALALEPCHWVLVAPDRLGVLHDLTATLGYARSLGRAVDAVVLSAPSSPDCSTGSNAAELANLGVANVVSVFPRAGVESCASLEAARALSRFLERLSA